MTINQPPSYLSTASSALRVHSIINLIYLLKKLPLTLLAGEHDKLFEVKCGDVTTIKLNLTVN